MQVAPAVGPGDIEVEASLFPGGGEVSDARNRPTAEWALKDPVERFAESASKLASRLDANVPEGLVCFLLPGKQRELLRTGNGIERLIQQEPRRRTRKIRGVPDVESLLRLDTAVLVEIDDEWTFSTKRCLPDVGEAVAR